jgi:hypothetical protein
MKTKIKPRPRPAPVDRDVDGLPTPPTTTAERLMHVRALGKKIHEYVRFTCTIGKLPGTSAEEKEKAVTAVYERLVYFEHELGRVLENFRLG